MGASLIMARTPNLIIDSYGELFSTPPNKFKQFLKDFRDAEIERSKTGEHTDVNISDYGRSMGILDHHITDLTRTQAEYILQYTFGEKPGKTSLMYQDDDDDDK